MMKKLLILTVLAVLIFTAFSITATAASSYVYDPYDLLSNADEMAIDAYLSDLNRQSAVEYYFVISYFRNDAQRYSGSDSVILLVEYDDYEDVYYYELFTYGDAYYDITDREANLILDDPDVYNNIKSGNIRAGALRAFELADTAVHGDLRAENWLLKTILTSLVLAVVISAIVCGIIIYKYKKKLKSPIYPLDRYARLDLIPANSRDIFLHKTLTRVRINTSSGSGGSGGRSGGGGSRGRR